MPSKGLCGDQEFFEPTDQLNSKIQQLANVIRNSRKCVLFTGAGISTSCGIPDFRGPNGVWTKELTGAKLNEEEKSANVFNQAIPSFTHNAITTFVQLGLVDHVISQNVDGLHLRSGLPYSHLSELHGNICMEICEKCGCQFFREVDVGGMGLKLTGNRCNSSDCDGKLRDFSIDWDTPLPEDIFRLAREKIQEADLCICIGTSLRIRPAGLMPLAVTRANKNRNNCARGKLVIINLQKTEFDSKCAIRIYHECDIVFRKLCEELAIFVDENRPLVQSLTFPPSLPMQLYLQSVSCAKEKKRKRSKVEENM